MIIAFTFAYMLYYIYWFAYVGPSLYFPNETNLIVMYEICNVFLIH
jgi:hypothetical protein